MITLMLALLLNGNPNLEKAIEQVRALEEQSAIESLNQAKNWEHTTPAELAQIHMWFGLAYAGLARESDARESFRAALLLDDTLELPSGTSPVVTQWWKELGGNRAKPQWVPSAQPQLAPSSIEKPLHARTRFRQWSFWTGVGLSVAGAAALIAGSYFWVEANRLRSIAEQPGRAWFAEQMNQEAIIAAQRGNWLGGSGGFAVLLGAAFLILNFTGLLPSETVVANN